MRATKVRSRVTKPAASRGLDNLRVVGQLEGSRYASRPGRSTSWSPVTRRHVSEAADQPDEESSRAPAESGIRECWGETGMSL